MSALYVTGIDENGLGPRLGPMTTTAVTIRLDSKYNAKTLAERGFRLGLTDSKAASSSRKMGFAESVALAIFECAFGFVPGSASEFMARLHRRGVDDLRSPCPDAGTQGLCHGEDLALPAFGGSIDRGREALAPLLAGRGSIRIVAARSVVNCVGVLNREHALGRNKLVLDLAAMEHLALDAARDVGPHRVIAGMIGGIRDVPKFASVIPRDAFAPREESRSRRDYEVDGLGSIAFEVDADATHLPVALASLVGKYLRELGMARIVRFHRVHDESLPTPSGYHDPVTARFAEASEPIRTRLAIAPSCFDRIG